MTQKELDEKWPEIDQIIKQSHPALTGEKISAEEAYRIGMEMGEKIVKILKKGELKNRPARRFELD